MQSFVILDGPSSLPADDPDSCSGAVQSRTNFVNVCTVNSVCNSIATGVASSRLGPMRENVMLKFADSKAES